MRRLLTAAVVVPLVLFATFRFPPNAFFVAVLVMIGLGAIEYAKVMVTAAPRAPLWLVPLWVPAVAAALFWLFGAPSPAGRAGGESGVGSLLAGTAPPGVAVALLAAGLFFTVGVGVLLLASGLPVEEAPAALGLVGFGIPYFALPIACVAALQRIDPWLLFLLYAIVWLGDTAAYYVGSALGRRRLAPRISPKKSWEGAIAGFLTGMVVTAVWSWWRLGEQSPGLLLVAAATAVAAQLGDLFESLLKRAVNTKDSGALLPGHGGMLDRVDAMLFAAPVKLAGLWLIGHEGVRW
jgi:phosphatidate cytidylyltransferase